MTNHGADQQSTPSPAAETHLPGQQLVLGRIVRFAAGGLAGLVGVVGLLALLVSAAVTPRRYSGCIVEPEPNLLLAAAVFVLACGTAALLACARRTTAGFVGGTALAILGVSTMGYAARGVDLYAITLGAVFLVGATLATCIEEFPADLLRGPARKTR